jgi:hydrogenase nickel incorporation protein HypB
MSRTIKIEKSILEKNDLVAVRLRKIFAERKLAVVNIMSSPGAGKTTLLVETLKKLSQEISIGVVEGDIATDYDAQMVEEAGAAWVVQINTGGRCHLEASMVEMAFEDAPADLELLIIENVGNLVCPSGFDLGEDYRVMLGALTEGLDKPKKYPGMFRACGYLVINKIDLASVLNIDASEYESEALAVNPDLKIFKTSATTGVGLDEWIGWLKSIVKKGE